MLKITESASAGDHRDLRAGCGCFEAWYHVWAIVGLVYEEEPKGTAQLAWGCKTAETTHAETPLGDNKLSRANSLSAVRMSRASWHGSPSSVGRMWRPLPEQSLRFRVERG